MTDLEINRLCAVANGAPGVTPYVEGDRTVLRFGLSHEHIWDPLNDDSQALLLVKSRRLSVMALYSSWRAEGLYPNRDVSAADESLNRAICLCVSRLPAASPK